MILNLLFAILFNLNSFYSEILLKLENVGFFFCSSGVGNGSPFQYSCLGNPMDRGDWQATVHGVAESAKTERPTLSLSSPLNRGKDA